MPYHHLDEFLIRLEQEGELIHVNSPSQSDSLPHSNALWIEDENTRFPVITNLFGTHKRMAWALGLNDLEALNVRLSKLLDLKPPNGIGGMMSRAGELIGLFRSMDMARSKTRSAPVQQHHETDSADATILPRRTITLAQVISKKSDGTQGMVLSDVEIVDAKTLQLAGSSNNQENDTAVAVVIGGDPAAMWCGFAPLPATVDPYLLAGWLRGKPVPMTNALTQPLRVPANAEIIIEGTISAINNGIATMTVTAISHRNGAVFPVICMDENSAESLWVYKAVERLLMPLLKIVLDEVVDINLLTQVGLYNLVLVSMNKQYNGQAQKIMHGIWGMGKLALARCIIVVDADIDLQNISAVAQALTQVDFRCDLMVTYGLVHHPHQQHALGSKIGIDATRKPDHQHDPANVPMDPTAITERIGQEWRLMQSVLVVHGDASTAGAIIENVWEAMPALHIVIVGDTIDLNDDTTLLRHVLSNFDAQRTRINNSGALALW